RADAQIKIRGQRIEPGEIEAAIAAHPGVAAAAVKLWPAEAVAGSSSAGSSVTGSSPGGTGQARLAAYYTLAEGYAPLAAAAAAATDAGLLETVAPDAAHGAAAGPDTATSDVPSAAAQTGLAANRPGTTQLAAMDPSVPQKADQGARHAHGSSAHGSAPDSATGPIPTEPAHAAADPTAHTTPDTATNAPADPLPDLADWIARHLAPAMQPDALILMDALPLTASGKLDRKALPKPQNWGQRAQNRAAPEGQTEQTLAAIWAETLGIDAKDIARDDSFFALGGHSLTAMRTAARIRDRFQTNTTLAEIFDTPTLKALAQSIDATAKDTPAPTAEIAPGTLSPAQHRMWFLQTLTPDAAPYNMPAAFDLEGDIDADALDKTLKTLAKTHDILRTIYPTTDGTPRAEITETLPDLIRETLPSRDAARARAKTLAQTPFALTTDIPIRAHLLTYATNHAILTLTLHHIAADGWALNLIHEALFSGEVTPAPMGYQAYAAEQRARLKPERIAPDLDWWADQLEAVEPLALPTDYPAPITPDLRGAEIAFRLPQAQVEALAAMARGRDATLYTALLTTLYLTLQRLGAGTRFAIGTPIAGRDTVAQEAMIGCFINTLAMAPLIEPTEDFQTTLTAAQHSVTEAQRRGHIPFEMIVDHMDVPRDATRHPLFQAALTLQNMPAAREVKTSFAAAPVPLGERDTPFDLSFVMEEQAGALSGLLVYRTALYAPETAQMIVDQWLDLIAHVLRTPERPLARLPMADADVVPLKPTATPDETLVSRIMAQADRDTPAIGEVSYATLLADAARLARVLRAEGLRPEEPVAVHAMPGADCVTGMLAAMMAGGCYLPLDPAHPPARHAQICGAAGVRFGFGTAIDTLRTIDMRAEAIDDVSLPRIRPDQLAYILFTSGSTGVPKGVGCSHANVLNMLDDMQDRAPLSPQDRGSWWTGATFDVSVYEIFSALTVGAAVHPVSDAIRLDPSQMLDWMRAEGISSAYMPPFMLSELASHPCPTLRRLLVGVEPIPQGRLHQILTGTDGLRIINGYGPTETTICATLFSVPRTAPARMEEITPIGDAVRHTAAYVLDAALNPVPVGVPGMLYVSGAGVSRGYVRRPDLTAAAFLPDPFSLVPGARMYATGDRVMRRRDGQLQFIGRQDFQLKIRGLRIEPAEVEQAILTHPKAGRAVVMASSDGAQLVAYIGGTVTEDTLRAHLSTLLPAAMIPTGIAILPDLPTLPSGKVDRAALPAITTAAADRTPPRTDTEKALATIWAEVLKIDRIAREDNFFSIGGDSILVIQVATRANTAGLSMTPGMVFRHQTLESLAAAIDGSTDTSSTEAARHVGPVPLNPVQAWFFEQAFDGPDHWNQTVLLRAAERLDPAVLARSLDTLAARHDAFRTRFAQDALGAWQQVFDDSTGELPLTEHETEDVTGIAADLQTMLSITDGPLARAALIRTTAADYLFIVAHHLIIDAQSWRVFGEELTTLYPALRDGQSPHLPAPSNATPDWLARLGAYGAALDPAGIRQRAAIGPTGPLPVDMPQAPNRAGTERAHEVQLGGEALAPLLEAAQSHPMDAILMAALARVLPAWANLPEISIDVERMGRADLFEGIDISRTLGWFTTLAPITLSDETESGVIEAMAHRIRNLPDQGLGHGIARLFAPDAPRPPRPEISFNYLGRVTIEDSDAPFAPDPRDIGPRRAAEGRRPYLIEISAALHTDHLSVSWLYSEDTFHADTIARLAQSHLDAIQGLIQPEDDDPFGSLDMASILGELQAE
ncbi:amino acid adenylation domain-containing protein/non-ribosomal peptide synthase protein (TIGR01720 family), partial [Rubricella aquisinus]